jgi:hypothetical protein
MLFVVRCSLFVGSLLIYEQRTTNNEPRTTNNELKPRTANKKREEPQSGPSKTTPQSRWRYFFFDAFFFLDPPFFLAAMLFTTFHAVRDLSVAHSWHYVPDRSDKLFSLEVGEDAGRRPSTERYNQHLEIII